MESRVEHYLSEFSSLEQRLPGRQLPWLRSLRSRALDRFAELGFPTPRQEDWKYTRVTSIEKRAFKTSTTAGIGLTPEDLAPYDILGLEPRRLVFVNGVFSPPLSKGPPLQEGVTLTSLAKALTDMPSALEPHLTRYADMSASGFSALNYAKAVKYPDAEKYTWEWLHLRAASLGGDNKLRNLVAGTYDANTYMIPLERQIAQYYIDKQKANQKN